MSFAAVLGAGSIGGAIVQTLARRARFREIVLIDDEANIAAGKALDISQSGPVDRVDVAIRTIGDPLAAAGAAVIIIADEAARGEWAGEAGLTLVRKLVRAGTDAPFLFAGPAQTWLLEKAHAELGVPAGRLVGSAPGAHAAAVHALVGLELGLAGSDVDIVVSGRPPAFVLGWSAATMGGALVSEQIPAHRMLAITQSATRLWPPGPYAIAAATAAIAEALTFGSRRRHQAMTMVDGDLGAKGVAASLPLELGHGRVLARRLPALSPQERTELSNALTRS